MHFIPEQLPLNDKAPQTDAEWEEALKLYGRDRDDPLYRSKPSSGSKECRHRRTLIPRRGMEGSDDSDLEDIDPTASMRERKKEAFGQGGMISAPPVCKKSDADQWDGAAERRRMRELYEKEGWLHGNLPSLTTKRRRRRVIRRLGLAGNAEADHERRTIISHYMDLAQLAFQVEDVGFAILRDDHGYKYSMDPDAEPILYTLGGTALSQFAVLNHAECSVIGDMSKDWRTCGNPALTHKGKKFLAAAPLLYPRTDPPTPFGALVIFGTEARTTFSEREQAMLLRISSMLVYQLATFQSELLAEKASMMYERSLAFLRRSVIPGKHTAQHEPTPKPKAKQDIKTRRSKREKTAPGLAEPGIPTSPVDSNDKDACLPPLVVKSGPKDQLDAARRSQADNRDLYQDAADTLRGILEADALAVIDMEPYHLYYRKTGSDALELDRATADPANRSPLMQFMEGGTWPEGLQPVVHYVPTSTTPKGPLLASSSSSHSGKFNLQSSNLEKTISDLLVHYLQTRQFWWDRDAESDTLGGKLLAFCPESAETILVHFMPTADGRIQHLAMATWDRPPSSFADSSAVSLQFLQILGGLSTAALNLRRNRSIEASQISYSNLQAHELRTPMHQVLAITSLLRSTMMDLAESQQCAALRDLIPMLDAIDTSGATLHGIVDNILSFLDLNTRDAATPSSPRAFDAPSGGQKTLAAMLEEVVLQAHEDNERSRRSAMQSLNTIETIFNIDPTLGTDFMEDRDGALRRAIAKILDNAYKFIEGEGCVEIKLSNLTGQDTLKDCQGVCTSRKVMIEIIDTGPGMDAKFVRDHLGEPWAKQDAFTTGSGLSVHLAYRIIDIMGGHMEVHSAPGRGCVVRLEVPVQRKKAVVGLDPALPVQSEAAIETQKRRVAIVGFSVPGRGKTGLPRLGDKLREQYKALGAELVDISEAELVVANGEVEEVVHGRLIMESSKAGEIVFFTGMDHTPHPDVLAAAQRHSKVVRRVPKPILPSIVQQTLAPPRINRNRSQHVRYRSVDGELVRTPSLSSAGSLAPTSGPRVKIDETTTPPNPTRPNGGARTTTSGSAGGWRPKGMCMEEAIANLSLGDYFSSTRRNDLKRTSSRGSTDGGEHSTPGTSHSGMFDSPGLQDTPATSIGQADEVPVMNSPLAELEMETIKVLVVEDNLINRKILVKILSKLPVEIIEAADGVEAVEQFTNHPGRKIVLLDINMPRRDGFQACGDMRALEKDHPDWGHAEIIAVTALSAEEEKRRGRDVGFDDWAVKPCGKAKITKLVETARKKLLGIVDEPDPELDRRYTI